uniref:G domain-containing protein n=1 Tax=Acanthochromis polyacanthus TaxID=80966 RepID=A0A3Q1H898_9TELE
MSNSFHKGPVWLQVFVPTKQHHTRPENSQENLNFVKSYQPRNKEVKHLRILLIGPVGSGKSSFINSVDGVFQDRITGRAAVDAVIGGSVTNKYTTYKISKDPEGSYSFVFNDTMGFERSAGRGVHVEDIKLALKGHVKDGYKFCASTGIPQLVLITKIDEACPKVRRNIKNAYWSKFLKEQVDKFICLLGIPLNCIFLVKNYHSETRISDDIDALILVALREMVYFGEDFLNKLQD